MFVELAQGQHPSPPARIVDSVGDGPLEDVASVLSYLQAGLPLIDMMDIENDVFDPERQIMNGATILTDGEWLWRQDLAYYVRYHDVLLPPDFLALIRSRDYLVPVVDEPVLVALAEEASRLAF
jgi:hypothetical protein